MPHPTVETTIALCNWLDTVTSKTIVFGDLNLHHPLWGSPKWDYNGKRLAECITSSSRMVCLNDGSFTHINSNNSVSHLDLAFATQDIAAKATWTSVPDSCNSNHLPCKISLGNSIDPRA